MKRVRTSSYGKLLSICLIAALIAFSTIASPAEAMFLPVTARDQAASPLNQSADLATIQKTLESRMIQQRLVDYGLSPEQALAKINSLSNDQVHRLATNIDALQAGGQMHGHVHGHVGAFWYGPFEEAMIILLLVLLIVVVAQ